MATVLERQIIVEGWRNCVLKLTGVIDSSDIVVQPALQLSDLRNNEARATLYALRVNEVEWSLSQGLEIALEWNSSNPQQILQIAGRGEIEACEFGGFLPDTLRAGFDGGINLRTQAYSPGTIANFSVLLQFVKMYR